MVYIVSVQDLQRVPNVFHQVHASFLDLFQSACEEGCKTENVLRDGIYGVHQSKETAAA